MSNKRIMRATKYPHLGFSMIDVLVAIVVLATGLLALAVLQAALTRNGVDARARTQVAAYAQGLIDEMRGGGYDAFSSSTTVTASSSSCSANPQSLAQKMQCDAYNAQTYAGVSNVSTTITSTEHYGSTGGTWVTAKPAGYTDKTPHYKDVTVATSWTDAMGQSRTLSFDTTVSPVTVSPTDNSLATSSFLLSTSTTPKVREANPGTTLGVIPIAISQTSDAAATNPKPVVTNTGTTFSQYTYNSATSQYGGNLITARVDTKVIQCKCKYGGPATSDANLLSANILRQPYRPTYWDGFHYTSPVAVSTATSSTTGLDTAATQDTDCDICCRDRNDTATDTVKFDSFSGVTDHYKWGTSNGVPTPVVSTDDYQQACRMIRVDGAYAVATDIHNYFTGLLATDTCANQGTFAAPTGCTSALDATDTVPASTTEDNYAAFVKDYLKTNLTALSTTGKSGETSASPQTTGSTAAGKYSGSTYRLTDPANITITLPNTVSRWQYARGLYVDYLESSAQKVLADAISACTDPDVNNCALPVLPFTTINMTELANWSTTNSGSVITVSDTAIIGGDETSPKRGNVTVPSTQNGNGNPTAYAVASTYVTNSGLTGVTSNQANSLYDINNTIADQRQFTVSGNSGGGGGGSGTVYFDVSLTGLSWMNAISNVSLDPAVSWSGTATQLGTAASGNSVGYLTGSGTYSVNYVGSITTTTTGNGNNKTTTTTVLPNAVSTSITPAAFTLKVQYFNNHDNAGSQTLTCTAKSGGTAATVTVSNATRCFNYQVNTSGILINGTAVAGATQSLMPGTTDGGMKEGAVITIPSTPGIASTTNSIAGADTITINFTQQTGSPTVAPGTCACTSRNSCGAIINGVPSGFTYTPGTCAQ